MTRAAIYCRISRDPTGAELGVKRQEADCRAEADRRGWDVTAVLVDNDISAYSSRKPRTEYDRLLELINSGDIDALVVWHPDRLHRRPAELEAFIDLVEAHAIEIATCRAGEIDLTTASGRMVARVVGAIARNESEQKSERLRRKHLELAEDGKVSGGGRAYGYHDDKVTPLPQEAALIGEAVDRVLAGDTIIGICRDWNRRGIPTAQGNEWPATTMRRMLTSPRIAGMREHRGEVVGDAVWPAVVDRDRWERVRANLLDPKRNKRHRSRRYLLTGGLAVCGLCGAKLVARPRADGRPCYVCATGPGFSGCGKIRSLAEPVEDLVSEAVMHRLDGVDLAAVVEGQEDTPAPVAEVERLEAKLAELAEAWAADEITRAEWTTARVAVERRLTEAREKISTTVASTGALEALDGPLRAVWETFDVDRRRAILDAVIDTVVVNSAVRGRNRFDPSRVDIRWKV